MAGRHVWSAPRTVVSGEEASSIVATVAIGFRTQGAVRLGSRVQKLLGILREPFYRSALRHGVAASIEHEAIPLRTDFRTVIDVGANRGQFALFAAHHFPARN
jgi:hypothetical protein